MIVFVESNTRAPTLIFIQVVGNKIDRIANIWIGRDSRD